MHSTTAVGSDLDTLHDLNHGYVRSVQDGDVKWFDEKLADDFICTSSDGSLLDRAAFLEHTSHPVTISELHEYDVNVRLLGDYAIIHARTSFNGPNRQPGASRYTDIWERRNGHWLCVAAQVTRY